MFNFKCKYELLVLMLLCFTSQSGIAQSLTINAANTTFTVSNSNEIETGSTLTSSFIFEINSKNRDYNINAAVTAKSFNPASTVFAAVPLSISLKSITGVNTTGGVTGLMQLAEYPPGFNTLATNATRTGNTATAFWTYDLVLSPIGYNIPPGNYVYTVTIQYSDGQNTINRTFNITIFVQGVVSLQLTQNVSPTLNFTSSAHFTSGITVNNLNTFTVKTNKAWIFSAAASTPNFSNTGTYSSVMPASILSLIVGSTQVILNTTGIQLNSGTPTSATNFNMSMLANPGYDYGPGIYNLSIVYTLTQQ